MGRHLLLPVKIIVLYGAYLHTWLRSRLEEVWLMKKIAVVALMVLLLTLLVVGATYALTNDSNLAQIASRYSFVGI